MHTQHTSFKVGFWRPEITPNGRNEERKKAYDSLAMLPWIYVPVLTFQIIVSFDCKTQQNERKKNYSRISKTIISFTLLWEIFSQKVVS